MCDSGISNSSATAFKTGMVLFFSPLPVAFPGRWKTEIDSIKEGLLVCSACKARRTVAESSSEPQNRMRSGSGEVSELAGNNGRDSMSSEVGEPTSFCTWWTSWLRLRLGHIESLAELKTDVIRVPERGRDTSTCLEVTRGLTEADLLAAPVIDRDNMVQQPPGAIRACKAQIPISFRKSCQLSASPVLAYGCTSAIAAAITCSYILVSYFCA